MNLCKNVFVLFLTLIVYANASFQLVPLDVAQKHILPHLDFMDAVCLTNTCQRLRGLKSTPEFKQIALRNPEEFLVTEGLETIEEYMTSWRALRVHNAITNPEKNSLSSLRQKCRKHPHLPRHIAQLSKAAAKDSGKDGFDLALLYDESFVQRAPVSFEGLFKTARNLRSVSLLFLPQERDRRQLLQSLSECKTLESLKLDNSFSTNDFVYYCSIFNPESNNQLKELELSLSVKEVAFDESLLLQTMIVFPYLRKLEVLIVHLSKEIHLPEMPHLEKLKLSFGQFSSDFLISLAENLDNMPQLKEFNSIEDYSDEIIMPFYRIASQKRPEVMLNCLKSRKLTVSALHEAVDILKKNGYRHMLHTYCLLDKDPTISEYNKKYYSKAPSSGQTFFDMGLWQL